MQNSLFRTSAVEYQKDRLHGDILIIPSASHTLITLLVLLWVIVVIAWMANSQFARKETVSGWLEPPSGIVKVYPQNLQGKITQILVADGQRVKSGQDLFVINKNQTLATGSSLEQTLFQEYENQKELLKKRLQRNEITQAIDLKNLSIQVNASLQDLAGLETQINTLRERKNLLSSRIENYQSMHATGHIAVIEVDRLLEQRLTLKSDIQSLLREQINRKNQISQLKSQQVTLPQEQLNQNHQIQTRLSELSLKIAQVSGQRTQVIKASRDGVVSNMQAKVGQQVTGDIPLLSLIPEGEDIRATLLIPVKAAGFIALGQQIEIRYDAFPYQKFGLYQGTISQISDYVILPGELQAALHNINEPAYIVHAHLASNEIQAFGKPLNLKSGMTLSADIKLSDRNLIEWVLEPLISLKGRI